MLKSFCCSFALYERQKSTSSFTSRRLVLFLLSFSLSFSKIVEFIFYLTNCSAFIIVHFELKRKIRRPAIVRINHHIKIRALANFSSRFFFIIISNEFYLFNSWMQLPFVDMQIEHGKTAKRTKKICVFLPFTIYWWPLFQLNNMCKNSMNKSRYFGVLFCICLFFVNNMLGLFALAAFINSEKLFLLNRLDSTRLTLNIHWKYRLLLFVAVFHINKSNVYLTLIRDPTVRFGLVLLFFAKCSERDLLTIYNNFCVFSVFL